VTLLSAALTSAGEGVTLTALCNDIAADFRDDGQAVVVWLRCILRRIVSE